MPAAFAPQFEQNVGAFRAWDNGNAQHPQWSARRGRGLERFCRFSGYCDAAMAAGHRRRNGAEGRGDILFFAYRNAYLGTPRPRTLDRAAVRAKRGPITAELRAARNDGQATGLAMKHLRQRGLTVRGEDVAAAVKELRAG